MDAATKKTALRMIPYGIYVMTAKGGEGGLAAATVNWVTQTAFDPPLLAIGVKADSGCYAAVKETGLTLPLVVRLEGNNVELGKGILRESGLPIISGDSMSDAAEKVVQAVAS